MLRFFVLYLHFGTFLLTIHVVFRLFQRFKRQLCSVYQVCLRGGLYVRDLEVGDNIQRLPLSTFLFFQHLQVLDPLFFVCPKL
mmetsp:Transcript_213/g.221  ORF Transcript_213/g.221 Transcript_213/m.221 type:complete len:83 (+) Transcript_213:1501-1749(+)